MDNSLTNEHVNLLSRLERLPFNKTILSVMLLMVLLWIVECFDIGIIAQVIMILKQVLHLTPGQIGQLAISSSIGIVIGVFFGGPIMDRIGRKKVAIWGVLWFSIFTVLSAAYPNVYWVMAMRFLAGLGEGTVFTLPYLVLSEFVPANKRAVLNSILVFSQAFGYMLPTIAGIAIVKNFPMEIAWRIPFLLGGIAIIFPFLLAKWMPESPRWLLQKGRIEEVRQMVENMEDKAGLAHDGDYINPGIQKGLEQEKAQKERKISVSEVLKSPYLTRTITGSLLMTVVIAMSYLVIIYGPMLFAEKGFNMSNALALTLVVYVISGLGNITGGVLIERIGRRPGLLTWHGVGIAFLLAFIYTKNPVIMVIAGGLAVFTAVSTSAMSKTYLAELFPTYMRGTGTGFGETMGRFFGGIVVTFTVPYVLAAGGLNGVFWFAIIVLFLPIIPIIIWGPETKGLSLEESSFEQ